MKYELVKNYTSIYSKYYFLRKLFLYIDLKLRPKLFQDSLVACGFFDDHITHIMRTDGVYEGGILDCAFDFLRKNYLIFDGCALDVGANIGNHSLYFSQIYSQVKCFEPNPKVFSLLSINIQGASGISALNIGLGAAECVMTLKLDRKNIGASRIVRGASDDFHAVEINVKKLDEVDIGTTPIALIKLDVEGFERDVLLGAESTITKHKPIILFEQSADEICDGSSPTMDLLKSYNYKFFAVERKFTFSSVRIPNLITYILRSLFGEKLGVYPLHRAYRRFYDLIIAVPEKSDL